MQKRACAVEDRTAHRVGTTPNNNLMSWFADGARDLNFF
jgi:hypothetical protein